MPCWPQSRRKTRARAQRLRAPALVGVAGLCLILAGCGDSSSDGRRTLFYPIYNDITEWDPSIAFSTESILLLNLYETLVRYDATVDPEQPLQPLLATHWSVSEDGLTWTFTLREGVRFHDGEPFNAAAAKASLERTIELGQGAFYIWESVQAIEAPDPRTLVIRTERPAPIDLIAASQYGAFMISPKAAAAGSDWFNEGQAAGTGPYRMRQWDRNQQVVIEHFEDYWQEPVEGGFDRVILRIVKEASTQLQLLLAGQADFAPQTPVDLVEPLRERDDIVVRMAPSWNNVMFLLNTRKYPTDNVQFRAALAHSWDYQGVVQRIYTGSASLPRGPIPSTLWGHDASLPAPTFDLQKARELLEASGIPREDWKLRFSYIGASQAYTDAAQLFQSNLAQIGVEVELLPGSWSKIWDEAKNQRTAPNVISMTWWPTYPTPSDWLIGLFRTEENALFNLSHYSSAQYDEVLAEGIEKMGYDRAAAIERFHRAQQILAADHPAIFAAELRNRYIHRADIDGLRPNPAYNTIFFHELWRRSPDEALAANR